MALAALPYMKGDGSLVDTFGTATLSSGTITIFNNLVDVTSKIFLTYNGSYGPLVNPGRLTVSGVVPGVSFNIVSTNAGDGSVVDWVMIYESFNSASDTFAYPVLSNPYTYGYLELNAGAGLVVTPYAHNAAKFILSLGSPNGNSPSTIYSIASVIPGSQFSVSSTTPSDASFLAYMIIYPSDTAPAINDNTVTYPMLFGAASINNYNIDQLVGGGVTINTDSAVANSVIFNSTHTFATTPSDTGLCYPTLSSGPTAINFTSMTPGGVDDQRINWWIINPTNGSP